MGDKYKMICQVCKDKFEYDEGVSYDNDTFVCYECEKEIREWKLKTTNHIQRVVGLGLSPIFFPITLWFN